MFNKIIVLNGKHAGQTATLRQRGQNVIGREAECALVLDDPACSRQHASIWCQSGRWHIADRLSANGTFVNGQRIEAIELHDGDKILIGSTWLRFVAIEPALEPPAGTPPTWILEDSVNPESSLSGLAPRDGEASDRRELDGLEQVSRAIARHTEPKALVEDILQIIAQHLSAAGAQLVLKEHHQVFAEVVLSQMPAVDEQTIQQAMICTEAVLMPVLDGTQRRRCIFAPLKYLDHVEGVLWVAEDPARGAFVHDDLCLVASIAHVLAPPLKMLLDVQQLQRKTRSLLEATSVSVVGRSPAMQQVLQMVARVADVDQTVLLRGESGVGKEVIARLIHETGRRRDHAMVCVNCAALPESLLESELFGHERGAFTGATATRPGKFETADGGSVFLDELGSMSLATQAKVLRVLDKHPFERVGGHTAVRVDVRVIGATNADLERMVREGRFREDLYHRLRVIEIYIPPLRERPEDVVDLARHFADQFAEQTGRRIAFDAGALELLHKHAWPGNVRQLRNTIERAAILSNGSTITEASLQSITTAREEDQEVVPIVDLTRAGIERAIAQAQNVPEAASMLGMSRSALYRHMKKLNIKPPRARSS